jgi:hypothetical protein
MTFTNRSARLGTRQEARASSQECRRARSRELPKRDPRELLERLQEVGLVEVVVLNQWSLVTVGGSPHPFVHGVESQDVREIFWSHAGVFQEPAFEMSPGPGYFVRQMTRCGSDLRVVSDDERRVRTPDLVDRVVDATRKALLGDARHDLPRKVGSSARLGAVWPQRQRSLRRQMCGWA